MPPAGALCASQRPAAIVHGRGAQACPGRRRPFDRHRRNGVTRAGPRGRGFLSPWSRTPLRAPPTQAGRGRSCTARRAVPGGGSYYLLHHPHAWCPCCRGRARPCGTAGRPWIPPALLGALFPGWGPCILLWVVWGCCGPAEKRPLLCAQGGAPRLQAGDRRLGSRPPLGGCPPGGSRGAVPAAPTTCPSWLPINLSSCVHLFPSIRQNR